MGALLDILRVHDRLPTASEVRAIIREVRDHYEARLTSRGFRAILSSPIIEETIREQSVLIGGLAWAATVHFLPWLHQAYKILEVERERLHFLDCTCGAGPLNDDEHIRRDCAGHALMLRTDALAQHRQAKHLAYFEFKTTGWDSDNWAEQWETKPQLGLGTLDLEKRYGHECSELYIVGLSKGARKKDDRKEMIGTPLEGMKRQQTSLCYGYCRPGNPPQAKDDWKPAYKWIDAAGVEQYASKAHRRRGVWELEGSDWGVWRAYRGSDPTLDADEFWVRQLPPSVLDKICFVLGPLNRQDLQIQSLRRSMLSEELRWQTILWELYEYQQKFSWASPEFQQKLDELVPQSWNCRPYGKEHECEMVRICLREAGWEDPIGSGRYQPRLPHHRPETTQAISRGLLPEQAAEIEEE
jgi:hypothetical protein